MQLNERRLVDLDSHVRRYLPWFRVADPTYGQQITIRQLLNQTSGLPDNYPGDQPVTSLESRVRDLATVRLIAAPGRVFNYSNSNYNTLGLVIEAVSGQSYADYLQEHVFLPLGMTYSYASESQAKRNGLGTAHEWWFGLPVPFDNFRSDSIPSGFVVSSAADMGHYLIAQLNGGSYVGHQVLSAAGMAEMHRATAQSEGTYGMGWYDSTINGIGVVYHPGDSQTGHADMIFVPSAGWGVELISDASSLTVNVSNPIDAVAKGVISMLMGRAPAASLSPLSTYIVFDLIVALLIGFQLWSLLRLRRSRGKASRRQRFWIARQLVVPVAWRLVLAVALLGLSVMFASGNLGVSPRLLAETDTGSVICLVAALLIVNGGLRAIGAFRAMRY